MDRKFTLSCCSTVDLPYSYMESRDIPVLFYTYVVDGVEYDDDMGRDPEALPRFYRFIQEGKLPQTSQINVATYTAFFEELLRKGDLVFTGRTEDATDGIYVHPNGFREEEKEKETFAFRQNRSRETAFSRDYDELYDLLRYERDHGKIVWVMGPAFAFDHDARAAMAKLIENGYVHAILAGNALATHDLEAAYLKTALGQDIYTQRSVPNGHYHHLDTINRVRYHGSIANFIQNENIHDGIIYSCEKCGVPYVLGGSIRDDGPLPPVYGDVYAAQNAMRDQIRSATTVISMATMLHTIATGNMTPSFRVLPDGTVRQVYFYCVDVSEFVVNKLADRGSLSATTMVTNVQDFIGKVATGLGVI